MAADFQSRFTNPCKLSPDGHFGSKFVTVVVTGRHNPLIYSVILHNNLTAVMVMISNLL